jgi:hypothetical protein
MEFGNEVKRRWKRGTAPSDISFVSKARTACSELMSVAEILHQIEALPAEERLELVNKLVEQTEAEMPEKPMTEAERLELKEKLMRRPNLGAELAESISRMKAGQSMELEEIKSLFKQLSKLDF